MGRKSYAIYDFPVGRFKISCDDEEICSIELTHEEGKGTPSELSELAVSQLCEYFSGRRRVFELPLRMEGTEFQKKVWTALREIPYGETCSYKDIASKVGNLKAARAVGNANNKNPFIIVIPCHRVIGADGKLAGYAGGLEVKKFLLELERKYR